MCLLSFEFGLNSDGVGIHAARMSLRFRNGIEAEKGEKTDRESGSFLKRTNWNYYMLLRMEVGAIPSPHFGSISNLSNTQLPRCPCLSFETLVVNDDDLNQRIQRISTQEVDSVSGVLSTKIQRG